MSNKICAECGEGELVELQPDLLTCNNCGHQVCRLPSAMLDQVIRLRGNGKKKRRG